VCNTYGNPREWIAIKQEDTLTGDKAKVVATNPMLLSISPDHTMGCEAAKT
jgi:hypothetical protein